VPRLKLTEKSIAKMPAPDPSGRQLLHWDTELRGFAILCSGVSNTRAYVCQRDLPDGRTRRVTLGKVNEVALAEARARAANMLDELRRGIDPKDKPVSEMTLRATLDAYLAARKDLRPASVDGYRRAIERYLANWLDRPLRSITPEMVEEGHRAIAAAVEMRHRTAYKAEASQPDKTKSKAAGYSGSATANASMRILRILWNFAAERTPELPANPVRRLRRQWFAEPRREGLVRTDELPAFYKAVTALPNPVARDYIALLLFTGLRRREAASLTWGDIDLGQRVIRLPATRTKAGRKLDLPMTDFVYDLLVTRRAVGDAKFVFPANSKSGHIEEPQHPLAPVRDVCSVAVSAHDLRRTFITIAESADISPLALKALVNHSLGGSDVTSGYIMMTAERLRAPAQKVADRIKQLCGITEVAGANVTRLVV